MPHHLNVMLKNIYIIAFLLFIPVLTSCSKHTEINKDTQIISEILNAALASYEFEPFDGKISESTGDQEFSECNSIIVSNAIYTEVADKIELESSNQPILRSWTSHGSSRNGWTSTTEIIVLGISYEENGAQYYLDFFVTQHAKDTRIIFLFKGIKR